MIVYNEKIKNSRIINIENRVSWFEHMTLHELKDLNFQPIWNDKDGYLLAKLGAKFSLHSR